MKVYLLHIFSTFVRYCASSISLRFCQFFSVAEDGGVNVLDPTFSSPPPLLRLTDIAAAVDGDWTRLARTLGVTECDISHIRTSFTYVSEQALVMLNGWMTSRQRHHSNASSPANELARALTCIRRDDVINAYLSDVITKYPRRDSATYADKGCI